MTLYDCRIFVAVAGASILVWKLVYYYYFVDIGGPLIQHAWTRSVVRTSRRSSEPARVLGVGVGGGEDNRRSRDRSPPGPPPFSSHYS